MIRGTIYSEERTRFPCIRARCTYILLKYHQALGYWAMTNLARTFIGLSSALQFPLQRSIWSHIVRLRSCFAAAAG